MATTIKIDPLTRIEGHLSVDVTVDVVDGAQQVIDARSSGTMFRGFEKILLGRDPLDAPHFTQRICGVCPVSHGMASCMNLESAFGVVPADNGRVLRNLVLGSNYIQSHVLHFYHLAALDYINTTGLLDMAPWSPRYVTDDMISGELAGVLVGHYVRALEIRRQAHQMGAIFGGKLPCCPSFVPGGCTEVPTAEKVEAFGALLTEIRTFVNEIYIPDATALSETFPHYHDIGFGCGNLLSYGAFELDSSGRTTLFQRGRYAAGAYEDVDLSLIAEDVRYSWFDSASGRNPAVGQTHPSPNKADAYSWIKAPRYNGAAYELGPLARMWINGHYHKGISVMDRLLARALETKKVADIMDTWLEALDIDAASYAHAPATSNASGFGLTEAPRGALGHWIDITDGRISRYQVITPTAWNVSPRDDRDQPGPMEQALIGTPVADPARPIEVLRVVHSFDPCLACSVHMLRPDDKRGPLVIDVRPSVG